jgi:hypothetical protein
MAALRSAALAVGVGAACGAEAGVVVEGGQRRRPNNVLVRDGHSPYQCVISFFYSSRRFEICLNKYSSPRLEWVLCSVLPVVFHCY